jgi:hypothetical protein
VIVNTASMARKSSAPLPVHDAEPTAIEGL